ncbi:MAG: histidine--tRNA ligase, partial [Chloroflexi bacterium]|nr:histidine--tRNA ligase [Chloroflexota bacterium]
DYVEYDARIVRGLDYYTGLVFEAHDVGESARAILGGGRYDNLVGDVGGDPLPGVGFAMGDVVLPIILAEYQKLPEIQTQPARVLVTVFEQETFKDSLLIAGELRASGIATSVYPEPVKLGKQFKYADRLGMEFAIVIGPDEISQDQVQVKNLKSGEQTSTSRTELAAFIKKGLPA